MPKSPQDPEDERTFGLDDVIGALAADLKQAQKNAAEDGAYGLFFKEAEIELQFTVQQSSSKEGGGGLNLRVFGIGVDGSAKKETAASNETIHRITLTLVPQSVNGEPPEDDVSHDLVSGGDIIIKFSPKLPVGIIATDPPGKDGQPVSNVTTG